MKKLVSLLVSVLLCASFGVSVFAADAAVAPATSTAVSEDGMQEFTETVGDGGLSMDFYGTEKLAFPQSKVRITAGSSVKIGAFSRREDGSIPGGTYSWKDYLSSSYRRISVKTNSKTGVMTIKGYRPGTIKITISAGGKKATLTVQVVAKSAAQKVSKITGVPKKLGLQVGQNKKITGKYSPSGATNAVITYASSKKSVATVSSNGMITAFKAGKTVITVKAGGKSAKCNVTVAAPKTTAPAVPMPTAGWTASNGWNNVAPGEYVIMYDAASGQREASVTTSSSEYFYTTNQVYAVVGAGERLYVRGGKFILASQVPAFPVKGGILAEGMYKVGRDIPAGGYKANAATGTIRTYNNGPFTYANRDKNNTQYSTIYVKNGQYVYIYGLTMSPM